MREGTCDDECVSGIEECRSFRILRIEIVPDESGDQNNRDDLEGESRDRESECDTRVIGELESDPVSEQRDISRSQKFDRILLRYIIQRDQSYNSEYDYCDSMH